ncbi:SixA phosphatase family protein [Gilvibacter sp.]|uniref:SixA phosphatase family protein n=1 Tax=Gilvibacter sp. TaxID=2729997 RepID=UPI003F4A5CDB
MNDAEAMALEISKRIEAPQLVISSPANRAHTTFLFFKEAFSLADERCRVDERLYDFGGQSVMEVIQETSNEIDSLSDLWPQSRLYQYCDMLGDKYLDNLPTCGFAAIEFQQDDCLNLRTVKH